MKRLLPVLAVFALVAAIWGLTRTVPRLGEGGPGFLAKEFAGVLGWSLIGALAVGFLWLSQRRPES